MQLTYNGQQIDQRDDSYINLTQIAAITSSSIDAFFDNKRTLQLLLSMYEHNFVPLRSNKFYEQIDAEAIYAHPALIDEFIYQSRNAHFKVWWNRNVALPKIGDVNNLGCFLNQIFELGKQRVVKQKDLVSNTYVYFILNHNTKTVKVGYSKNPVARLNAFQTGTLDKLEIIYVFQGGRKEEACMHSLFRLDNVEREIFNCSVKMENFLRDRGVKIFPLNVNKQLKTKSTQKLLNQTL